MVVRPEDVDIVVTPESVADLYDPSLVISPGYIGPDRRRHDRSTAVSPGSPLWLRRVMLVVFLTAVVVAPLTIISSRSVPPAATAPTTLQPAASSGAGSEGASPRSHVFTASRQEVARAEAAYQRALARAEASGAVADPTGPVPGPGSAVSAVDPTSGAVAAATPPVPAPVEPPQQSAQQAHLQAVQSAAAQRAAALAQAEEARSAAQAAAAQNRAALAAARAQALASRRAARGDSGSGGSTTGTTGSGGSTTGTTGSGGSTTGTTGSGGSTTGTTGSSPTGA
ncbi:MAG: hypothetical protein ABSF84_15110 [Acidimicrobiales bacterium]